jgi:hypothetical protein
VCFLAKRVSWIGHEPRLHKPDLQTDLAGDPIRIFGHRGRAAGSGTAGWTGAPVGAARAADTGSAEPAEIAGPATYTLVTHLKSSATALIDVRLRRSKT